MRRNSSKSGGSDELVLEGQPSLLEKFEIAIDPKLSPEELEGVVIGGEQAATTIDNGGTSRLVSEAPALSSFEVSDSKIDHIADLVNRFPDLAVHQSYKLGSSKARLVSILNQCLLTGSTPRSETNRKLINRTEMAGLLAVNKSLLSTTLKTILVDYEAVLEVVQPVSLMEDRPKFDSATEGSIPLDDAAKHVIAQFPNLEPHQYYPVDSTARKFVLILNGQLFLTGDLKRSRGGKVDRRFLTDNMGLSKSAYIPYRDIVDDYEAAVGNLESSTEGKIPEMRRWLEQQIQDRTLLMRDGKISRIQFLTHFGFPINNTIFIRYPRVGALIAEFDRFVAETSYRPGEIVDQLRELRSLLADPPVGKDAKSFNKKELARLLGIEEARIKRSPLVEIIEQEEAKFADGLQNDPLIILAGGRVFKLGSLIEQGWSKTFVSKFKDGFQRRYGTKDKDKAKVAFASALELLSFIGTSKSIACEALVQGLSNGLKASALAKEFTLATQAYRDSLAERYEHVRSRNTKLTNTNGLIKAFSNDGLFPPFELGLIAFREDNPGHIRSVAEVTPETKGRVKNPHVDGYLEFATSMLKQAADVRQIEITGLDQSDFNKVLRAELEERPFNAAENPAKVILGVLTRRLDLLKAAAAKLVKAGQKLWDRGRRFIGAGAYDDSDIDLILFKGQVSEFERRQLLRKLFPNNDAGREQGIANLLALVANRYGSIFPSNKLDGREEGQFFQKRALEYGGGSLLQSYLLPSQEAVAAVITLYMLESGSNVSVGRTLYADTVEPSEEPNHSKVTGYKARASGKPIFATLPDRCDAIKGMNWLKEAFEGNSKVLGEDRNQMFLCKGNGEALKLIEEWTYRSKFKKLAKLVPELGELPLTPNMLRPSILLKAALEENAGTSVSRALGQHGAQVHEGYVNKYPIRYLRDTDIRLFQYSMETVVIQNIENVHEFLGVNAENMSGRIETVMRTGLGTMCADRFGKPGNEGKLCQSLDCVRGCPQLILIAIPREIAILQLWQHSLRLVQGDWVRDQPERWGKVWLPWLMFCDAVEVKMKQTYSDVWSDAAEISGKMLAHPNFAPMRLF